MIGAALRFGMTRYVIPAVTAFSVGALGTFWALRIFQFDPSPRVTVASRGADAVSTGATNLPATPTAAPSLETSPKPIAANKGLGRTVAQSQKAEAIHPQTNASPRTVQSPRPATVRPSTPPHTVPLATREPSRQTISPVAPTPSLPAAVAAANPLLASSTRVAVLPVVPAPPNDVASPVEAPLKVAAIDAEDAVRATVQHLARAYKALDVSAAIEVWPSVDRKALTRAFSTLRSQGFNFENCRIEVEESSTRAIAQCRGVVQYVRKVGSSTPREELQEWRFALRQTSAGWKIDDLDVSPDH
jgi:hypothetical protein